MHAEQCRAGSSDRYCSSGIWWLCCAVQYRDWFEIILHLHRDRHVRNRGGMLAGRRREDQAKTVIQDIAEEPLINVYLLYTVRLPA